MCVIICQFLCLLQRQYDKDEFVRCSKGQMRSDNRIKLMTNSEVRDTRVQNFKCYLFSSQNIMI